jgi:hypothetical protein
MQTTPERHKICAEAASRAAESLEAGARNPALDAWARIHYAALARMERLAQAYHEEAARDAEQGRPVQDWLAWLQSRGI